jgi:hypothetical protein
MEASRPQHVEAPKTPVQSHSAGLSSSSPPNPTPSKLHRFLVYAEKNLSVLNATGYEFGLEAKGYGADILHLVSDDIFNDLGMQPGDVL